MAAVYHYRTADINERRQKIIPKDAVNSNTTNMKTTLKTTLKTLLLAVVTATLFTTAYAESPGNGYVPMKKASTVEEIQKLKKGDKYAVVCKECDSITVKKVADAAEVEALCHDGGSMHCDSCKKKHVIKRVGPPGKETITAKVVIVNAEGKECMFIVPMKE